MEDDVSVGVGDQPGVEPLCEPPVPLQDDSPSASSVSAPDLLADDSQASPRKMRKLAREIFVLPIALHTPRLPDSELITMTSLLAWHGGDMMNKNKWQNKEDLRRRRKSGLQLADFVTKIAKNPLCVAHLKTITGKDRVYASHIAAKVMASAYNLSVRKGREAVQRLWPSTPQDIKNKWFALSTYEEYNDQWKEEPAPDVALPPSTVIECYGAMMTWQTPIGRCSDRAHGWVNMGLSFDNLCDLLKGDAEVKAYFDEFASWVAVHSAANGFRHWSAASEVCPTLTQAIVHLHAFVCCDWKSASMKLCQKGRADRQIWQFKSFHPMVSPANIRGNMNAQKTLPHGLFYCMVDKIGGLFNASNVEAGKDRSRTVLGRRSPCPAQASKLSAGMGKISQTPSLRSSLRRAGGRGPAASGFVVFLSPCAEGSPSCHTPCGTADPSLRTGNCRLQATGCLMHWPSHLHSPGLGRAFCCGSHVLCIGGSVVSDSWH